MSKKGGIVFFLGVGFSKGFDPGLPSVKQLSQKVLECLGGRVFTKGSREKVASAISKIFPDASDHKDVDFELFVGALDSLRRSRVDSKQVLGKDDPNTLWRLVIAALGRVLLYPTNPNKVYQDWLTIPPLSAFIETLTACNNECQSVSVITTNYDLITDKAVHWVNDRTLGYEDDSTEPQFDLRRCAYGAYVRGVWEQDLNGTKLCKLEHVWEPFEGSISLYKLHGSLNWAYCERCGELDLHRKRKDLKTVFYESPVPCGAQCGGEYSWLIVPPTHLKEYGNPFLQKVWHGAERVLAEAQCVVFIGYSLLPADPLVRHLLLQARAKSKTLSGKAWKYWVFDKNRKSLVKYCYRPLLGTPVGRNKSAKFNPEHFRNNWLQKILDAM